jgi:hypothetical protein
MITRVYGGKFKVKSFDAETPRRRDKAFGRGWGLSITWVGKFGMIFGYKALVSGGLQTESGLPKFARFR